MAGSPAYMAPEVLTGKYDFRCDFYSLGVLIFELATGDLPSTPKDHEFCEKDSKQIPFIYSPKIK